MHPSYGSLYSSGIADISITSMCNYQCVFCLKNKNQRNTLTRKEIFKQINDAESLGLTRLIISGGDPLLHPDLIEVCEYARDCNFITAIATNGSLLTKELIELLRDDVDWFILPVDSKNKSTEIMLGRGNGSHLSHLLEIGEVILYEEIGLHLYSVVTSLNVTESFKSLIYLLNPDLFTFILHYQGKENRIQTNKYLLREDELLHFYIRNNHLQLKNGLDPSFIYSDEININNKHIMKIGD